MTRLRGRKLTNEMSVKLKQSLLVMQKTLFLYLILISVKITNAQNCAPNNITTNPIAPIILLSMNSMIQSQDQNTFYRLTDGNLSKKTLALR
jgi:hypothetical protein